jgi:molybdopterin synthase sulfur carrier subunit
MSAVNGITVRLFGGLDERAASGGVTEVEPSVGTVGDLLAGLELPATAVGLVLVNGLHADFARRLQAGDEVALFPPLGGG